MLDPMTLLDEADRLDSEGKHADSDALVRQAAAILSQVAADRAFAAAMDSVVAAHSTAGQELMRSAGSSYELVGSPSLLLDFENPFAASLSQPLIVADPNVSIVF
jgi:hypothetical protein